MNRLVEVWRDKAIEQEVKEFDEADKVVRKVHKIVARVFNRCADELEALEEKK